MSSPQPTAPPADAVRLDPTRCIVCGGAYEACHLPGLFRCARCGLVSADLRIPDAELAALYGENYFYGEEYLDYVAEEPSLRLNFRKRIKTLKALRPDLAKAELFEVGCAYGFFLSEIAPHVHAASGVDISQAAVRYAAETLHVPAVQGNYLDMDLGRRYDLMVMWDTIEHLKRPDLFIGRIAEDLKPGGLLALTTGDIDSLNARWRGPKWRLIHPPTHLHYFSVKTITTLLDRHGFDVVHVSHPGNARTLRWIFYAVTVLRMKKPKLYELLPAWRLFDLGVVVNLFDIMFVVARRRASDQAN
jgi:SAM-dependent methyltransferase